MNRTIILGLTAALTIGCASAAVNSKESSSCPEGGLRTTGSVETPSVSPPTPLGFFLPPLPPLKDVRGHMMVARLVVDTTGWVMRDSVAVCGIPNPAYAQKITQLLANAPFHPARRPDGEAVRASVIITYPF